ncbi:MAG: terminase family protein [Hyphomonadaceae bacterium]|nr:terminase family protein [Hyphomonadaceae bacterium]
MVHPSPKRRRGYTEEDWRAAMTMYAEGASAAAVSARHGMSVSAIYTKASALGLTRASGRTAPPKTPIVRRVHRPQAAWDAAIAEYLAGETATVVCRRHGINRATFHGRICREGMSKTKCATAKPPDPDPTPTPEAAAALWRTRAHAAQLPPDGAWRTWLFQGGRGAGKTRAGAEWIADFAARHGAARIALVGGAMRDVREVMIDGPSGLAHLPDRAAPRFEAGRQRLVFPSGAVAFAFSSQEPERLRGPQFDAAWADEFCAWARPAYTLTMLRMGLRRGVDPRLVVTTTPKPMRELRRLRGEASCVVTQAGSAANAAHLAPGFLENLRDIYGDTRFAAQELDGVMVETGGALWRAQDLALVRGHAPPAYDAVVVAVDPPAGAEGAACGIVAAGRVGRRGFVLADETARGLSPLGWAQRACDAARRFGAQRIVAEANQGGAMVRAMLASAGAPCAVRLVHATDAKRVRAEPVAALYEQGRVTHCGAFAALEEEMMALSRDDDAGLRDRVDALVWALTALLVEAPVGRAPPRVLPL